MSYDINRQLAEDVPCPHDVVAVGGIREELQYLECLSCGHRDYAMNLYIAAKDAPDD